jgi:hypothetical protein
MLRENNSAGSEYVFMGVTGQGGSVLQSRASADGASVSADGPEAKLPHWLKLVRNGNVFNGYVSADGTNWLAAGSVTNTMNKKLSVGLALTAHNNSVLNSTLFDNVAAKP